MTWETDDDYRARLIAERVRLGLPQMQRAAAFLAKATGFELDLWGRDLATPRLGASTGHAAAVLAWDASTDVRPQPAAELARALEGPACHGPDAYACMVCGLGFPAWRARDFEGAVLCTHRDQLQGSVEMHLASGDDEVRLTLERADTQDLALPVPTAGQLVRLRLAWPQGCVGEVGRVVALRVIHAFGENGPVGEVTRAAAPLGSASLVIGTTHGVRVATEEEMRSAPPVGPLYVRRVEDTMTAEDRAAFAQRLKDIGMAPGLTLNVVARGEARAGQMVTAEDVALPVDRTPGLANHTTGPVHLTVGAHGETQMRVLPSWTARLDADGVWCVEAYVKALNDGRAK